MSASYCKKIFLIILFCCSHAVADTFEYNPKFEDLHFYSMFTNIPSNLKTWWGETFSSQALPYWLSFGATTGVLMLTDYETWQMTKVPFDSDSDWRKFMMDTEKFGGGYFQLGSSLMLIGAGVFGNSRALRTAYQIGEAILSSGVVVQILKRSTGRESPKSSLDKTGRWRPFPDPHEYATHVRDYDAMPSGHLSSALAALVVIQENYPEYKWIPYVGYPIMGILCLSFSATSIHWWSDYPLGIALGYHFAKIATRRNHGATSTNNLWEPQIFPQQNADGVPTVTAQWVW